MYRIETQEGRTGLNALIKAQYTGETKAYFYASMKHRSMLEKVTLEIKREEIAPCIKIREVFLK